MMKNNLICKYTRKYCSMIDESVSKIHEYIFFYHIFRFCNGNYNARLKVPGTYYSLHMNTYAPRINLPKFLRNRTFNFHIAFINKFPFIITGYKNVWKYMENIIE